MILFMTFGLSAGTSSGSSGSQLWKLTGASPSDIELNTAEGAAGITATLPGDTRFRKVLSLLGFGTDPFAGDVLIDGDEIIANGIIDDGVNAPVMKRINTATGEDQLISIDGTTMSISWFDGVSRLLEVKLDMPTREVSLVIDDASTGDGVVLTIRDNPSPAFVIDIMVGGISVNSLTLQDVDFKLGDAINAVFRIAAAGDIQTNQVEALTGNDPTETGRIPISDPVTGVPQGYIVLQVDP